MRWSLLLLVGLAACKSPEQKALPRASASHAPPSVAAPVPLEMHPWLTAKDAVRVHDVAGAPMVTAGAVVLKLGDPLSQDPALGEGLEGNAEPSRVVGEFPDATFLVVALSHRVTGASLGEKAYRWYAKRWAPAPSPLHDNPPIAVVEHRGATVALLATPMGLKLEVARATEVLTLPPLPSTSEGCASPFVLPRVALVSLSDGLAVVGERCDGHRAAIVHLEPPARETLFPDGFRLAAVRARGGVVFAAGAVSGKGALFRYDGARISPIEAPLDEPLTALALGGDGSIWVSAGQTLAVRSTAGAWSRADLPSAITGVVAVDETHAWATIAAPDGGALYATSPTKAIVVVPDKRASFTARGQHGKALATSACTSLWVPLVAVGKAGWVPDDLPWLRESIAAKKELAGIRYLAEDDGRETWIGALVPTLAAGEQLVADVGDRIGIGGQRVTCHTPHDVASFVDGRREKRK